MGSRIWLVIPFLGLAACQSTGTGTPTASLNGNASQVANQAINLIRNVCNYQPTIAEINAIGAAAVGGAAGAAAVPAINSVEALACATANGQTAAPVTVKVNGVPVTLTSPISPVVAAPANAAAAVVAPVVGVAQAAGAAVGAVAGAVSGGSK